MTEARARQIVVAGAGIAGLTAALAFAERGYPVRIFERTRQLEEVGAGLQLSPNATHILDRLGVLPELRRTAVQPEAVVMRDASSFSELGRVQLGSFAEKRWGAPYLTVHRADLQSALLAHVEREPAIRLTTGAAVRDISPDAAGITVHVDTGGQTDQVPCMMLVAADGVWSDLRRLTGSNAASRFAGQVAWRRTIDADSAAGRSLASIGATGSVTAFLAPGFHVISYPVKAGSALNIVAFTQGQLAEESWSSTADNIVLKQAMRHTVPALRHLADDGAWTVWPVNTAPRGGPWTSPPGIALIGDAAHALTPYAAQGAAMAIEDAETLAGHVLAQPDRLERALTGWETERRKRIERVARRGAFNKFTWHAAGPIAAARNVLLRRCKPESLAESMDWLYGWRPPELQS